MEDTNQSHPDKALPDAETGNASNPSPHDTSLEPNEQNQLLDTKAETYLREAGNIEDEPDPQEQKEADDEVKGQQGKI